MNEPTPKPNEVAREIVADECLECGEPYESRNEGEPGYCDPCAQELLAVLQRNERQREEQLAARKASVEKPCDHLRELVIDTETGERICCECWAQEEECRAKKAEATLAEKDAEIARLRALAEKNHAEAQRYFKALTDDSLGRVLLDRRAETAERERDEWKAKAEALLSKCQEGTR